MTGVRFGVLGRLEITHDGEPVTIGSAKARILLATLLLRPNQILSIDALVERMWDGDGPQHARAAVQTHVARLRAALGAGGAVLRTHNLGYSVAVADDDLDLIRFDRLVAEADAAIGRGEQADARELLRAALGLWRGACLTDVDSAVLHHYDVAPLVERTLTVTAQRAEIDLLLGRHGDLTAEFRQLTALHPHRESLWAIFMRALYGAGRQAEALEAYRTVRRLLADDLGIDPGHDLQRLHQRMLLGEELADTAPPTDGEQTRRAPNSLPRDLPDFTGRDDHMAAIAAAATAGGSATSATLVITAIDGMAGVGKTALAVHAAHHLAPQYPHGQLYVDLHGFTAGRQPVEPFDALGVLLVSVGVPADQLPDSVDTRAARWRAEMNDRKAIVVLDNAATATQLLPLLPGAAGSLVLVTGRRRLTGLDGTRPVSLDVLPPADAVALFHQVTGRTDEPDAAAEVVALCGHLPLAIRIAAARLTHRPSWTVDALAKRLRDDKRRLTELAAPDRGVAAAFAVSYGQLSDRGRSVFRRLGLMPCADLDLYGVAAIAGVSHEDADAALDELIDTHLIQETAGKTTRYTFHDLLRDFARERAATEESAADREAAVARVLDFYVCCLYYAHTAFFPEEVRDFPIGVREEPRHRPAFDDMPSATRWLHAESRNLRVLAQAALDRSWNDHAIEIPKLLTTYHYVEQLAEEDIEMQIIAVTAARRKGDPVQLAQRTNNLAVAYEKAGRYAEAMAQYQHMLDMFRGIDDPKWTSAGLGNLSGSLIVLGRLHEALTVAQESRRQADRSNSKRHVGYATYHVSVALTELGEHHKAEAAAREALSVFEECGDTYAHVVAEGQLGKILSLQDRFTEAIELARRCTAALRARGDRTNLPQYLNEQAEIHRRMGDIDEAFTGFCQALDLCRQVNFAHEEARSLEGMAKVLDARRVPVAMDFWRQAVAIYERLGVPDAARARAMLLASEAAATPKLGAVAG